MSDPPEKLTYGSYLKIPTIISCQELESEKEGNKQHDEHLFKIIHQVYELWFKQVLVEVISVCELFGDVNWDKPGKELFVIINRQERVTLILRLIAEQFPILQTMTANDFLEFRKYLKTGSGFESLQFRKLESVLGIRDDLRQKYDQKQYKVVFNDEELKELESTQSKPTLFRCVQTWLENIPGRDDFRKKYLAVIDKMLAEPKPETEDTDTYEKKKKINEKTFLPLKDEKEHKEQVKTGVRRLSHPAMFGALMVFQYREEPRFQQPFKVLSLLMDIDGLMARWRSNHVTMVHRMIGNKPGTGGSSGKDYLASTINDHYKVFVDLFDMPTFLLEREKCPAFDARWK